MIRIGTAGWNIPKAYAREFLGEGTHLERYAKRLPITEINQTFYKLPRVTTLQKWRSSTPADFRFSLKLHRSFTHFHKLTSTERLQEFIETVSHLQEKLFAILVQLPPSLQFHEDTARSFFGTLRRYYDGYIAIEPRHPSWMEAEALLQEFRIASVAADPARYESDSEPGGYEGFVYYRLHGAPKMYYSEYSEEFLQALARKLTAHPAKEKVVIFDNTASGAAIKNALKLVELVHEAQ